MSAAIWVSRLILGGGILLLAGCATSGQRPLYMWEAFPRQQYETLLNAGASPLAQMATLEAQAEKAGGVGAALPPGFRAHLGMLKLSVGDLDSARQLWIAEKTAFPESAAYMDRLLKPLDGPAKTKSP